MGSMGQNQITLCLVDLATKNQPHAVAAVQRVLGRSLLSSIAFFDLLRRFPNLNRCRPRKLFAVAVMNCRESSSGFLKF